MDIEAVILEIRKDLKEIKSQGRPKQTWVSASWIMELTGWDAKKMENARKQNIITYRAKKTGGIEYLLQSVPDEFKIKQAS